MPNREERRAHAKANGVKGQLISALVLVEDEGDSRADAIAVAVVTGIGMLIEKGGAPLEHCSITLGTDHPSHPGSIVLELATDRIAPVALKLEGEPLTLGDLRALTNTEGD